MLDTGIAEATDLIKVFLPAWDSMGIFHELILLLFFLMSPSKIIFFFFLMVQGFPRYFSFLSIIFIPRIEAIHLHLFWQASLLKQKVDLWKFISWLEISQQSSNKLLISLASLIFSIAKNKVIISERECEMLGAFLATLIP